MSSGVPDIVVSNKVTSQDIPTAWRIPRIGNKKKAQVRVKRVLVITDYKHTPCRRRRRARRQPDRRSRRAEPATTSASVRTAASRWEHQHTWYTRHYTYLSLLT